MKTLIDPRQKELFDPWKDVFWPSVYAGLKDGWQGVMRNVILAVLPADDLGAHLDATMGRPSKELYAMAGLLLLKESMNWTEGQAVEAWLFRMDVQYALNLGRDRQQLGLRSLQRYIVAFRKKELEVQVMEAVSTALVAELDLRIDKQRLDSTHVFSQMAAFTRTRLLGVTVRRFLAHLQKRHASDWAALPEALRTRYAKGDGALFGDVPRAARAALREEVAAQMHGLIVRFENTPHIAAHKTFRDLVKVFGQQCEVTGNKTAVRAKTGAAVVQNPSDDGATYHGRKGPGYQVQLSETCHEDNEVQLVTCAIAQSAHEADSAALLPVLEQLRKQNHTPCELLADTVYGSDENHTRCAQKNIELLSPVPGPAPRLAKQRNFQPLEKSPPETSRHWKKPRRKETAAEAAKAARLAARREAQNTEAWRTRYRKRAGIESLHSALKRKSGLGRLRVRGTRAVSAALLLRVAGHNIRRAAPALAQRRKTARPAGIAREAAHGRYAHHGRIRPLAPIRPRIRSAFARRVPRPAR